MLISDTKFEDNWIVLRSRVSSIRFCWFSFWIIPASVFREEKLKLDNARVVSSIPIMTRFSIVRCLGVFLSPNAFLKSLITLLKEKEAPVVEDIEADTDTWPLIIPAPWVSYEYSATSSYTSEESPPIGYDPSLSLEVWRARSVDWLELMITL